MSDDVKPSSVLPWETTAGNRAATVPGSEPEGFQCILDARGRFVADLDWSAREDDAEQDAAYIVHAANEYPKLVARVAELEAALGDIQKHIETAGGSAYARLSGTWNIAQKALNKGNTDA